MAVANDLGMQVKFARGFCVPTGMDQVPNDYEFNIKTVNGQGFRITQQAYSGEQALEMMRDEFLAMAKLCEDKLNDPEM